MPLINSMPIETRFRLRPSIIDFRGISSSTSIDFSSMESYEVVIIRGIDLEVGESGRFGDEEDGKARGAIALEMTSLFSSIGLEKTSILASSADGTPNRTRAVDGITERSSTTVGSTIMGFSCYSPLLDEENFMDELFRTPTLPERVETMGDSRRIKGA